MVTGNLGCGGASRFPGEEGVAPAAVYGGTRECEGVCVFYQYPLTEARTPGVGGRGGAAKRSAVSTGWLSASLRLHARPIDPVVSREPSSFEARPDLEGSFTLICLQRLSVPHVATRRYR